MQAETIFLSIIILCVVIILIVVVYGMYQEYQYRKEIFRQFGNAHQDVLMEEPVKQVRDGEKDTFNSAAINQVESQSENEIFHFADEENNEKQTEIQSHELADDFQVEQKMEKVSQSPEDEKSDDNDSNSYLEETSQPSSPKDTFQDDLNLNDAGSLDEIDKKRYSRSKDSIVSKIEKIFPKKNKKHFSTISIQELEDLELPWFNRCFDYMAYIILDEPKELHVLPRLSSKHRFRIAAYNLDDQFQLAEPIPGVKYQAYVIGLQAISRSGLASKNDLNLFGKNVQDFAKSLEGQYKLTDIEEFYEVARPMDELCARVDQIIGLHLVSRESVNGIDLRETLEKNGFMLSHDGAFYYPNYEDELFKIVNIDETPFTPSLLASNSFRGFSILFDITHVPAGYKNFDLFMGLAVGMASELGLDLVDDQIGELSTEWLKNIRNYVLERQKEMEAVGIKPGEELAKRLFA